VQDIPGNEIYLAHRNDCSDLETVRDHASPFFVKTLGSFF
jgi:hypothetical protein